METVKITTIKDNSVEKVIQKVAKKLKHKYNKKRKINEKVLKESTGVKKVLSIIMNIVFILIISICSMLCFSTIVSRVNGTVSSFAGYSLMRVSTTSMEASGFYAGDNIVVRSVKPSTLRVGDKIAFYVYKDSYSQYYQLDATKLELEPTHAETDLSFTKFFSFQSTEIRQAAKAKSAIVFHQIAGVYEDENGERWFETRGTSNGSNDVWKINQNYVLGIYDNSLLASGVANILNLLTNDFNFLLLIMIPLAIFSFLLVFSIVKDVQKAKLELDVVEEKRKLTDEICVKNEIGFGMDTKTKYKVLAQAKDEEKKEYLSLLWKDGTAPNSIKKYVLRKQVLLAGDHKLLELNRKCEQMFKENENPNKIAEFYITEKEKIETEQFKREKKLKKIRNS